VSAGNLRAAGPAATFRRGFADALPICFGYCAVAFTIAAAAIARGFPPWAPSLMSLTHFSGTSQGAIVGRLDFTAPATAGFAEVALLCIALNLRYALMALALSQKLPPGTGLRGRLVAAVSVTDEIVAVAVSRPFSVTIPYVGGLCVSSMLGWNGGTLLGVAGTALLPERLVAPLGIALYAMFVAIVVPAAKASRKTLFCVLAAIVANVALSLLPASVRPPSALAVLLSGVAAAAATVVAFPPDGNREVAQ